MTRLTPMSGSVLQTPSGAQFEVSRRQMPEQLPLGKKRASVRQKPPSHWRLLVQGAPYFGRPRSF
jgi:hypothetical protein